MEGRRRITVNDFKSYPLDGRLESGIVPPLRPRQPFNPMFRLISNKAVERVSKSAVQDLGLPVGLGVVCRAFA